MLITCIHYITGFTTYSDEKKLERGEKEKSRESVREVESHREKRPQREAKREKKTT